MKTIKLNPINLFLLTSLILASASSLASVSYDDIKSSGSACPTNDSGMSFIQSPDSRSTSILLNPLSTEIKSTTGQAISAQKECFIEANFHANYDEQYVITKSDWRGSVNSLPSSTTAVYKTESWLSYRSPSGAFIDTEKLVKTNTFIGPINDPTKNSVFISSSIPEIQTITECGQSFKLNNKITYSLNSSNLNQNIIIGIDSLDLSQNQETSNIKKIPCLNPWNAELEGQVVNETATIKITTEKPKINQMASLYTVGIYQGHYYSYTVDINGNVTWTNIDFERKDQNNPNKDFKTYGTFYAPETLRFPIHGLSPTYKGAVVYVGVGYGPDEESRYKDMLNTLRYKLVYSIN